MLVPHVPELCFFGLRKMVDDIFDVDEGPCDVSIVGFANGGQPCGFYGKTRGSAEIANRWGYAGDFIHIIYRLLRMWVFFS